MARWAPFVAGVGRPSGRRFICCGDLRSLVLHELKVVTRARSGYLEKASNVSADVAKEFMTMKFMSGILYLSFMKPTCLAIKSKNVLPPVTSSNDFALSRPIPVPRPPLSLSTTVCFNNSGFSVMSILSNSGSSATESSALSGIMVEAPDVRTLRLYLKALMAASLSLSLPPAFIFASYAGQSSSKEDMFGKSPYGGLCES